MKLRQYMVATSLNLLILGLGILIGRQWFQPTVHAAQTNTQLSQPDPWTQEPEYITPGFTVGAGGIGTLIANRITADQIVANGYDLLKLQNGILQLLRTKHLATFSETLAIAEGAKVRLIRIKPIATVVPKTQEAPK